MIDYFNIISQIKLSGKMKENRTGVRALTKAGAMFEHDMQAGFPLLTSKYVHLPLVASELEFFIKGLTDKTWLRERRNYIWDEWCNPKRVPYGHDKETRRRMQAETDLGPIYGKQWRAFDSSSLRDGIDQLKIIVDRLKTDPDDRRMIVSAWNPRQLDQMALPPCHWGFQVTVIDGALNMLCNQRSVDVALGLPFNIASYGLLLLLLALESGLRPGTLIGFLGDVHIYENHLEGIAMQERRPLHPLPTIDILNFTSIFDWEYTDLQLNDYVHSGRLDFKIAV